MYIFIYFRKNSASVAACGGGIARRGEGVAGHRQNRTLGADGIVQESMLAPRGGGDLPDGLFRGST